MAAVTSECRIWCKNNGNGDHPLPPYCLHWGGYRDRDGDGDGGRSDPPKRITVT